MVAGFFNQVLAHDVAGVVRGVAFNTGEPADLFQTVLITLTLSRPLRWAVVFTERNDASGSPSLPP
jgi:hypothetical protein